MALVLICYILFVIVTSIRSFFGGIFNCENFSREGKFLRVSVSGKILHWRIFPKFLYKILTLALPNKFSMWRWSGGKFSAGLEVSGGFFFMGYFRWRNSPWRIFPREQVSTGYGGISGNFFHGGWISTWFVKQSEINFFSNESMLRRIFQAELSTRKFLGGFSARKELSG